MDTGAAQTTFDKSLTTGQVTAISFGLVVCVSTWGATLIGFGQYGMSFIGSIVLAGLFYYIIAMNYAELATMYPRAASIRTYVESEFGNKLGTMSSMVYVLSFATGLSAEVVFFGYVLNGFVPSVSWWVWALLVATFGLVVNMMGIKRVGDLSSYLLYVIAAITLLVGFLAFTGITVASPNFERLTSGFFTEGFAGLAGSFLLAMWLFAGFEVVCPLAEECRRPERSLPRGMFSAIALIGILNIIFGLGAYLLVSGDVLASEQSFSAIGASVAGSFGVVVLFLFAAFCTTATVMTNYSSVSRLMYGMAEKPGNMLPAGLKWLHPRFKTPWRTLVTYYVFTLALILPFGFAGGIAALVYIASFIWIVQYLIAITANIALRVKCPGLARPYRVPGGPIPALSVVGLLGILFFLTMSVVRPFGDPNVLYYGGGMIVAIVLYGAIMGAITRRNEFTEINSSAHAGQGSRDNDG